jgi:unsaturated rhamnogalacturonyl hydrolase
MQTARVPFKSNRLILAFIFMLQIGLSSGLANDTVEVRFESVQSSLSPRERARHLADYFILKHEADELKWDWGPAFFLYGLSRFSEHLPVDKRQKYTGYIEKYQTAYHPEVGKNGLPLIDWSDRCPSALSGLWLAEHEKISVGMPAAKKVAHYLKTAPRNSLGALDHLGTSQISTKLFPHSIWVDSLVMYAVFAAQWARHTGDAELMNFAVKQPLIFAKVLQDPGDALFRHAYNTEKMKLIPKKPGGYWLRGNGWVLASIVEILDVTPLDHPLRQDLVELFRSTAEGALRFQKKNGLWSTIMNRENYYEETSGSAIMAYAFAKGVRLGYLDGRFRLAGEKAMTGLEKYLREVYLKNSEKFLGVSMSGISWWTVPGPDFLYRLMPRRRDMPYGVGAYLLAATEYE